jgi:tripartite-type tricarboxylate transporter receptor subunit TctC
MNLPRRHFIHLAAGVVTLPAVSGIARAQTYPSRPIAIVVPYAAGGPTDLAARIVGEHMVGTLGQTITVENVSGGAGTIGTGRVARGTPDGSTLLVHQTAIATNVTFLSQAAVQL